MNQVEFVQSRQESATEMLTTTRGGVYAGGRGTDVPGGGERVAVYGIQQFATERIIQPPGSEGGKKSPLPQKQRDITSTIKYTSPTIQHV